MKKYKITVRETTYTDYYIQAPDDCDDPEDYFYAMESEEQEKAKGESDCFSWEVTRCEERK